MRDPSLEQNLTTWLAEGILSEEQAEAIRAQEARLAGSGSAGFPVYALALGYAVGAVALGTVFVVMSGYWGALGFLGRTLVVGALTAGLLGSGIWAVRQGPVSSKRLGEFLLALAVISAGLFAGMVVDGPPSANPYTTVISETGTEYSETSSASGTLSLTIGSGVAFALAAAVWIRRKSALPLVMLALSLGTFIVALTGQLGGSQDNPIGPMGTVFFFVGIAWLVLAERGVLRPRDEAWSMGSLALGVGIYAEIVTAGMSSNGEPPFAVLWFGLAVSLLLLLAGVKLGRGPGIGFGSVGVLAFAMSLLFSAPQTDSFQFAALGAIGVALLGIGVGVLIVRRRASRQRAEGDPDGIALLQVPESAETRWR
jgi:hypothetical protein